MYLSLGSYGGKRRQLPGHNQAYVLAGATYSRVLPLDFDTSKSLTVGGEKHLPMLWYLNGHLDKIPGNTTSWYRTILSEMRSSNPLLNAFPCFSDVMNSGQVTNLTISVLEGPRDNQMHNDIGRIMVSQGGG